MSLTRDRFSWGVHRVHHTIVNPWVWDISLPNIVSGIRGTDQKVGRQTISLLLHTDRVFGNTTGIFPERSKVRMRSATSRSHYRDTQHQFASKYLIPSVSWRHVVSTDGDLKCVTCMHAQWRRTFERLPSIRLLVSMTLIRCGCRACPSMGTLRKKHTGLSANRVWESHHSFPSPAHLKLYPPAIPSKRFSIPFSEGRWEPSLILRIRLPIPHLIYR